jgi:ABC-type transporter Mla maintaining outer membrane lipid asymmetry permease subunit MlaE
MAARLLAGRLPCKLDVLSPEPTMKFVSRLRMLATLAIAGLVGIAAPVVAQQGAVQLRQFGADIFTVNLIGRATTRELGILLTAIMVAGRSGSAFAAQIGSMNTFPMRFILPNLDVRVPLF